MRPNRLVAGPAGALASIVAGLLATWLAQHAPFLHVSHGQVQQAVVFLAGVLVHEAGRQQWLKGWREFAQAEAHKLTFLPASVELGTVDPPAPPVPDDGLTEQLTRLQADLEAKDAAIRALDGRLADRDARLAQFRTLIGPEAVAAVAPEPAPDPAPVVEPAPEPPAQP